jgi:hypothetical protein
MCRTAKTSTEQSSSNVRQRTESAVKDTPREIDCLLMYYIATITNLKENFEDTAKSLSI